MKLHESTDRSSISFILFAMGFAGFWIAGAGIIVGSPLLATFGGLLLLLVVSTFFAGHLLDND